MTDLDPLSPPPDLDWPAWVARWDHMQQRYLVKRAERFDVIVSLIKATQPNVTNIIDLGCGTGSLTLALLEAFPQATVIGFDFDPTLLWLARARLDPFKDRAQLELSDLREPSWTQPITAPVHAVVSATALHWFNADQLAELYQQVARVVRPGGIFLNADHVGSDSPDIQRAWESHRAQMRDAEGHAHADDWNGFWIAYAGALGLDVTQNHQRVLGGCTDGIEQGLPLPWHLDRLTQSGFTHVDCFWRCDCDAIYGGIR